MISLEPAWPRSSRVGTRGAMERKGPANLGLGCGT